jgi:hypothetical protein
MPRPLSVALVLALALPAAAVAQDRQVQITYTPTARAQIALWIESADGERFSTISLTDAVAYRGIGNRPGALEMNSGFHWPYGRREGVLPIWAHRRAEVMGSFFARVIFDGRASEGNASSAGSRSEPPNTRDDYFCLSFTGGETLDAVTCASIFNSNKGRYITPDDVATSYAEPFVDDDGTAHLRALGLTSLYPPRRDVDECLGTRCDHDDVYRYASDALDVMPELDAVSLATPPSGTEQLALFAVPNDWPAGDYTVFLEINVEGDYAPGWDATARPTPRAPSGTWDSWAMGFGYPYRGQPSVVFEVPIVLSATGGEYTADAPVGYGAIHGDRDQPFAMDDTILDDPAAHPGSGADRLFANDDGARLSVRVPTTDICLLPDAPPECGRECDEARPCALPLECSDEGTCVAMCLVPNAPGMPSDLVLAPYPDVRHAHQWIDLSFVVPTLPRPLLDWDVRVSTEPIVDEASFVAARPAKAASIDDVALTVPTTREDGTALVTGDAVALELGGLDPTTHYYVGVRAIDACGSMGPVAAAEIQTAAIHFTTVSPCFVATAAYGSPLDARIGVLRRFRDRYLRGNGVGDALVEAYERVGPVIADAIRDDEDARAIVRWLLAPVVTTAEALGSAR